MSAKYSGLFVLLLIIVTVLQRCQCNKRHDIKLYVKTKLLNCEYSGKNNNEVFMACRSKIANSLGYDVKATLARCQNHAERKYRDLSLFLTACAEAQARDQNKISGRHRRNEYFNCIHKEIEKQSGSAKKSIKLGNEAIKRCVKEFKDSESK